METPTNQTVTDQTKTTETAKRELLPPVVLEVEVVKVIYRTNALGQLFPIFQLVDMAELREINVDSILFKSMSKVTEEHYGIGAKLKVEFDVNTGTPTVLETIKPSDEGLLVPDNCASCDSKLLHNQTIRHPDDTTSIESTCPNLFCPALSRGFLYKMFKVIDPNVQRDIMQKFLNLFPVGNASGSIDSFAEFGFIFGSVKAFNTQGRLQKWTQLHGEEFGNELFLFEDKVIKFLTRSVLTTSVFWDICNFPKITEKEVRELSRVNPQKVIDMENLGMVESLSNPTKTFIKNNADLIAFLLQFFNQFGEKTWSSLKSV